MARRAWRDVVAEQLSADDHPASDWVDVDFEEAIQFLREKGAISDSEFAELDDWARRRAFTVAGVAKLDLIQATLDELRTTLESGGTLADFAAGVNDLFAAQGVDPLDPWRLETIFRTNVQSAYGAGRWDQLTDPEVADQVFGWEFDDVRDDREDEECEALGGHVFEGQDGAQYFPPIHYNCRCTALIITAAEAEANGISGSGEPPAVARDFVNGSDFTGPALGADLSPDLSKYAMSPLSDYLNERNAVG